MASERDSEITLLVQDALKLCSECGRITGLDLRHEHTTLVYNSPDRVINGLIEE